MYYNYKMQFIEHSMQKKKNQMQIQLSILH